MAHLKIITPGCQDFQEPTVSLVKLAKGGLRGSDLAAFVKRASVQFLDKLASIHFAPGEVPVHLIAMGATEYYGPNRNGDGFSERVCREYHPTFKKYARWYRDHDNKDKTKGRGIIKASAYNGAMHRVELLVALNSTKEAADRNGGLVADEEMEKLSRGEDIPVSMACRVSHDVCSGCGNKAKTRAEYCGPEMCKYGGCRGNLGKTFDDGHTLFVDNPDPSFFDISKVFRPADRTAYVLGLAEKAAHYERLVKEAAEHYGAEYGSSALAEKLGIAAPLWLLADTPWADPRMLRQLKVASALVAKEQELADSAAPTPYDRAFLPCVQTPCADALDVHSGEVKLGHVTAALAAERCMLPVDSFLVVMLGRDSPHNVKEAAAAVAARLPGVFTRMASDPQLENQLRNNPYMPAGPAPRRVHHWALKHAADWSLKREHVTQRLQLATLRHPGPLGNRRGLQKVAAADATDALATQYALYQLGLLATHSDADDAEFMQDMAIRANSVQ
jgi:hypothetical protein